MSTVVKMKATVGPYKKNGVYRVRTKLAQELFADNKAVDTGDTRTDASNEGI